MNSRILSGVVVLSFVLVGCQPSEPPEQVELSATPILTEPRPEVYADFTLTADLSLVCFLTPFLRVSKHLLLSFTSGADLGDSKVVEASRAL